MTRTVQHDRRTTLVAASRSKVRASPYRHRSALSSTRSTRGPTVTLTGNEYCDPLTPDPAAGLPPHAVSYAELHERVAGQGPLGKYLVDQLIDWNTRMVAGPIEHRSLGDSPAIGVMMDPECGECDWVPGPEYNKLMTYVHTGRHRPIRLYRNVDQRFILEDLFAKLARFARGVREHATFT